MKQLIRICSALALLLTATPGQAQEKTATLHQDGRVEIPAEEITNGAYEIDISMMGFHEERQAIEYFRAHSGTSHFYRPVLTQNKAVLYLKRKTHPEWSAVQWNDYLSEKKLPVPSVESYSAEE